MANLADEIEQQILDHHLPMLGDRLPAGEVVLPCYDGYSIINLPATTATLLGARLRGAPPLPSAVWRSYAGGVRCVIRVIIDALGYYRLLRFLSAERDTLFHHLLHRGGQLIPLTSVCPTTTTTALSSLWTGRAPVEHGMLGTRLFLRERGLQANMIYFTPTGFERHYTLLEEGMKPAEFLPVPGMAQSLADQGIESHVFINNLFAQDGLSDVFFRGVTEVHEVIAGSAADLWTMLRGFLEERIGERLFISVYWGLIDALSHFRGPASPAVDAALRGWTTLMKQEFIERLNPSAATGTVLTILADHGQVDTPAERAVRLDQHPELFQNLLMKPVGEQRLPFLFARQGKTEKVRRYVQEHLADAFILLDSELALDAGLFGSGTQALETSARLGDFVLISRHDHILYDGDGKPHLLGLHGGLSPEETLVPFLMARLDA
jgi:hypothetical protein